jgi:hypothetical protein
MYCDAWYSVQVSSPWMGVDVTVVVGVVVVGVVVTVVVCVVVSVVESSSPAVTRKLVRSAASCRLTEMPVLVMYVAAARRLSRDESAYACEGGG